MIQDKYDGHDPCPGGALRPLNIDAKLNGAYIVLGLLYGNGDFGRPLEISTRAGQDSDCNPASAGGILGVMHGYRGIPEEWKGGIEAIADEKFQFTDFSFRTIVESSCRQAVALVKRTGGREENGTLVVKTQQPVPPALEVWDPGRPVERIPLANSRWKLQGDWTFEPAKARGPRPEPACAAHPRRARRWPSASREPERPSSDRISRTAASSR